MTTRFDERQIQLQHRGYPWALAGLIGLQLGALHAELVLGHPLFASQLGLISVTLALTGGGLITYFLLTDAYLTPTNQGLLPVLALVLWALTGLQIHQLVTSTARGTLDPLWVHGQIGAGATAWALVLAVGLPALTATGKAIANGTLSSLRPTPRRLAILIGWVGLLALTLWVRAGRADVHTSVGTTVTNFLMMLLPLIIVDGTVRHHRRLALAIALAWAALLGYLQLFH
ncbi:hypothetical protein [Lacticaseibacillus absianus]|uniref:hypothetical protein n=1 Tax=Lacticaseibacillus absianus TaxID=2729623 RepID=UPI0015CEB9F6|nr:hypothetical protein [Lacticaseibacillus absianus]